MASLLPVIAPEPHPEEPRCTGQRRSPHWQRDRLGASRAQAQGHGGGRAPKSLAHTHPLLSSGEPSVPPRSGNGQGRKNEGRLSHLHRDRRTRPAPRPRTCCSRLCVSRMSRSTWSALACMREMSSASSCVAALAGGGQRPRVGEGPRSPGQRAPSGRGPLPPWPRPALQPGEQPRREEPGPGRSAGPGKAEELPGWGELPPR